MTPGPLSRPGLNWGASPMKADNPPRVTCARPFRPFPLIQSKGWEVALIGPERIAYGGGQIVAVIDPDRHTHIIELAHVERIELGEEGAN